MAEHHDAHAHGPEHVHGQMDIAEHEKTFEAFLRFWVLVFGASASGYADLFVWPWQLIVFAAISVLTVFWVRTFSRAKDALSDEPALNVRGAQYVGRIVTVEDPIAGGRGRVRVGDTLWPAQGPDTAKGARVKVTGTNGTVLIVEQA